MPHGRHCTNSTKTHLPRWPRCEKMSNGTSSDSFMARVPGIRFGKKTRPACVLSVPSIPAAPSCLRILVRRLPLGLLGQNWRVEQIHPFFAALCFVIFILVLFLFLVFWEAHATRRSFSPTPPAGSRSRRIPPRALRMRAIRWQLWKAAIAPDRFRYLPHVRKTAELVTSFLSRYA